MRLLIVDHNPLDSSAIRSLYQKLGEMRDIGREDIMNILKMSL